MKVFGIAAIALLLSAQEAQAIKFFDIPIEENSESLVEVKNMNKVDAGVLETIDKTIDQATRNAAQGELGRTLAMNKVNEIKLELDDLKTNFISEAEKVVANGNDEEAPLFTLEKKRENVNELDHKAKVYGKRIPQIQNIEYSLGLAEDVKDSELTAFTTSLA